MQNVKCIRKKVSLHSLKAKVSILKLQYSLFVKYITYNVFLMMVADLPTCVKRSNTKPMRKGIEKTLFLI